LTQIKEKTFIGLDILRRFLDGGHSEAAKEVAHLASQPTKKPASSLAKRVIACLDVRSNDAGDLVVTKGDQYDVREQTSDREVQTHT
jgi:glutamine amidotransferase/cyclase